ncbi:MAG: class I SAM-dependent methyltransferase [Burkholderiaceae bacterium]
MLQSNNPNIDTKDVAQRARHVIEHRRREVPLFTSSAQITPSFEASAAMSAQRLRNAIKRTPVIGGLALWAHRQVRYLVRPGLSVKQRIRGIPGLGGVAAWCYSILFLNRIRQSIAEQFLLRQDAEICTQHALAALSKQAHDQSLTLMQVIEQQRTQIQRQQDMLACLQLDATRNLERDNRVAALQLDATRNLERDNRVAALIQSLRRMEQERHEQVLVRSDFLAVPASVASFAIAEDKPDLSSFYIEFEDNFRGACEDIKERLKRAYLSYLTPYIGDLTARAVDVGAGRGEWLALMQEQGISAVGVDLDENMVDACLQRGLNARVEDAVHYLARQPPGSVAIISGFHIIEHLPFKTLIALFDAALQALRPDGIIIFETPNPENLIVGSCNFYYDPTHLHPIVPAVGEFMARQRGFARAEILRLHPYPESMHLIEDSELAQRINQLIYGPQDFAILAWKSNAN